LALRRKHPELDLVHEFVQILYACELVDLALETLERDHVDVDVTHVLERHSDGAPLLARVAQLFLDFVHLVTLDVVVDLQ